MAEQKEHRDGFISLVLGGVVDPILQVFLSEVQVEEIPGGVKIICPNEIIGNIIHQKYSGRIQSAAKKMFGENAEVLFGTRKNPDKVSSSLLFPETVDVLPSSPVCPNYTFENWVVGKSNQMASVAALAVAEAPGSAYNPLFLYGGSGLGKTHLLCAIGNYMKKHKKGFPFCYVTAEEFTTEFIQALQEKRLPQFRKKFRSYRALLIDDIQFFQSKEATQEAFFHLFNSMINNNHQVVISSDCSPSELKDFTSRLVSRFSSGLVADIQPPNYETRIAILKIKMQELKVTLPNFCLGYLAENFPENVRELEGALHRVIVYHSLHQEEELTSDEVLEKILKDLKRPPKNLPSADQIIHSVAQYFSLPAESLLSRKRTRDILFARQVAIYLIRKTLGFSLPEIGHIFQKDHTTILHSLSSMEKKLSTDGQVKSLIAHLEHQILSHRNL
ncbi:MAG: chromosomal replication initiator protein DnaA [bacterium JZ-2024 1]